VASSFERPDPLAALLPGDPEGGRPCACLPAWFVYGVLVVSAPGRRPGVPARRVRVRAAATRDAVVRDVSTF